MSEQNVKAVRDLYEAFGRGDIPFILGVFDGQIEWREADNFIYADGNPYIGPTAVLQGVFARYASEWDGFAAVPDEIYDAGETVISRGHYLGKYRATGREVRAQYAHFFTFESGKIKQFQQYTDTAQFRSATD